MNTKNFPLEAYGAAVSREELVQAALDEITKNYREASLSNVARSYGVSLAYVSECVRAQTGRTYKELLQKHRMETAARLLRRSDWNIQQIITYVGYENTSYFYRLFHERYGLSPREYRLVRTGHGESLRGHHVESLAFLSGKAFLFHGAVPDRNRILFGPQYNEIRPPRKKGRNMGLFRFDQGCGRRMCSLAKGTDAA